MKPVNINTRQLQIALLDIMKVFHNVCKSQNIGYYMLGGTLLGAIRHRGFIPWDDDIDVGLPRTDYERLLNISSSCWPKNITIKTPYNSTDLIFPYSKIMDINTTLVEDRLDGIIGGIYIDVFPLDGMGNIREMLKFKYGYYYWKQGLLYNNQDYGEKRTIFRRIVQKYARLQNTMKLYNNVERFMKRESFYGSTFVGNYAGRWGARELVKREIFGEPTLYDFEGYKFFGVQDADSYLKSIYGDYMQMPPIKERKSHHHFIYVNLDLPYKDYDGSLRRKPQK